MHNLSIEHRTNGILMFVNFEILKSQYLVHWWLSCNCCYYCFMRVNSPSQTYKNYILYLKDTIVFIFFFLIRLLMATNNNPITILNFVFLVDQNGLETTFDPRSYMRFVRNLSNKQTCMRGLHIHVV